MEDVFYLLVAILFVPITLIIVSLFSSLTLVDYTKNLFKLNDNPLYKQKAFWLAVLLPIIYFLYFGAFVWKGKTPQFDAAGFSNFVRLSALPLSFLPLSIALGALVTYMHSAKQIAQRLYDAESQTSKHFGSEALRSARSMHRFQFDDQTYVIRRNLMAFSSLAFTSTFISPTKETGLYEVNLGILKGSIDNPVLVYLFLALICLYYLVWFYLHCKRLVINNYTTIKLSFTGALARLYATNKFTEFTFKNGFKSIVGLGFESGGGGSLDLVEAHARLPQKQVIEYEELIQKLKEENEFIIEKTINGITIKYIHNLKGMDLIYLDRHIDSYWRTRKEDWFLVLLPVGYSLLSITLVIFHIYRIL